MAEVEIKMKDKDGNVVNFDEEAAEEIEDQEI